MLIEFSCVWRSVSQVQLPVKLLSVADCLVVWSTVMMESLRSSQLMRRTKLMLQPRSRLLTL